MSILAKRGRLSPWGWSSRWLWVSHYGAENEAQVLKEQEVLPHHPPPLLLVNTIQLASDRPVETTRATTWLLHVWLWWNLYVCLQQMSSCHLLRQSKAGLSWASVCICWLLWCLSFQTFLGCLASLPLHMRWAAVEGLVYHLQVMEAQFCASLQYLARLWSLGFFPLLRITPKAQHTSALALSWFTSPGDFIVSY